MLSFPTSTVFERRIPKQKFYQNLDVTADVALQKNKKQIENRTEK